MYFNYLIKRDSGSIILYSQSKDVLKQKTNELLDEIFGKETKEERQNNPDILEISLKDSDKLSIGIENVKNIIPRFQLKPIKNKYKVMVISDSEKLTRDAQGGLLKTIEEPPKFSFVIIQTTNINSLLPTIKSRCNLINLNTIREKSEYSNSVLGNTLDKRLKIVKTILDIKDPRERRENVEKLFIQIFSELDDNSIKISYDKKYLILESVFKYQEYFKSEVNLRLSLENLMISMYKILKY